MSNSTSIPEGLRLEPTQAPPPCVTPSMPSIYSTLPDSKKVVRICDLSLASDLSAPLEASLRIVSIEQMGIYIAFSYVWGEEPVTEDILINGIHHLIRPNLAAGLRALRAYACQDDITRSQGLGLVSIWVDAICINQNDVEERNHQVPHMRLVFSDCDFTFSWLGEADDTSDLAMDSISEIAGFEKQQAELSFLNALTRPSNSFCKADPWVAIRKLLTREFWHRVWIYQELILPDTLSTLR